MPRGTSLPRLDKALATVGLLARRSAKLSPAEKAELGRLAGKAPKTGRLGLTHADRARMIWLIRKAGPDKLPNVEIPERMRKLLKIGETEPKALPIRTAPAGDPLDRLQKLGALRGKPLTEAQFEAQRARILADPTLGGYSDESGGDPLDRLGKVAELQEQGVLTADQAEVLTEQILGGG